MVSLLVTDTLRYLLELVESTHRFVPQTALEIIISFLQKSGLNHRAITLFIVKT